jgi:hypothetical protein
MFKRTIICSLLAGLFITSAVATPMNSILRVIGYHPKPIEQDLDCTICLESIDQNSIVTDLSCSHKFHTECLKLWFNGSSASCPNCRSTPAQRARKAFDKKFDRIAIPTILTLILWPFVAVGIRESATYVKNKRQTRKEIPNTKSQNKEQVSTYAISSAWL